MKDKLRKSPPNGIKRQKKKRIKKKLQKKLEDHLKTPMNSKQH